MIVLHRPRAKQARWTNEEIDANARKAIHTGGRRWITKRLDIDRQTRVGYN